MSAVALHTWWKPGCIGETARHHGSYYHEHWGFDITFERQVAREVSQFFAEADPAAKGYWSFWTGDVFAGCIAVDGSEQSEDGPRLRWYFTLPDFRGKGMGSELMKHAVAFCRGNGYSRIHLWTFQGLDPARRMYERTGFHLVEERPHRPWGRDIVEQKFVMDL